MSITKHDYEKYLGKLEKLVKLHKKIKDIDVSLSQLYPIAIVENNDFIIFDFDESLKRYCFVKKCPTPMPMPKGVKAAFDIQDYEGKMAAVLSEDTFDTLEGYVFAFHEFVHCYQGEVEISLKEKLGVYQDAMVKKDYMWEINHPFPYEDEMFMQKTKELEVYLKEPKSKGIDEYYRYMNEYLYVFDFEYMIWQQWKEGYARYIENRIRANLGLKKNSSKISEPFNRVSFYEIGSRYIEYILSTERELSGRLEELFYKMIRV